MELKPRPFFFVTADFSLPAASRIDINKGWYFEMVITSINIHHAFFKVVVNIDVDLILVPRHTYVDFESPGCPKKHQPIVLNKAHLHT